MVTKQITVIVGSNEIFFYTKEDAKKLLKLLKKLGVSGKEKVIYCG